MMLDAIEQGEYDDEQLREMFGDMLRPLVEARSPASRDGRQPHAFARASGAVNQVSRSQDGTFGKSERKGVKCKELLP